MYAPGKEKLIPPDKGENLMGGHASDPWKKGISPPHTQKKGLDGPAGQATPVRGGALSPKDMPLIYIKRGGVEGQVKGGEKKKKGILNGVIGNHGEGGTHITTEAIVSHSPKQKKGRGNCIFIGGGRPTNAM